MNTVAASPHIPEIAVISRVRSRPAAGIVLAYLFFCLLCFTSTYFGLNHRQSAAVQFLKHSTFFYSGNDYASASFAAQTIYHLPIHTVNLLAPGAGATVYRLTGTHEATSPTLVIPTKSGPEILSGANAVNQALQPFSPQVSPFQKAKWALVFMAGLIVLAIIFEAEISAVAAYLPLLGIVAIGALWGRCLHCNVGGSMLSTLAPLLGLVYLGGGGGTFHLGIPT